MIDFWCFNDTFSNISAISWQPVLVVEEAGVPDKIHHDLKELDEWSKKWLMSFNPDKTEIMLFSNTDIPEFNNTFNGRTIPITNSHKHLGVTFSSDAKWNIHVENILL